ncbi:unnamed protein product [Kuraishia capsulata CBS 1993]|uniref:Uncharacterized protein n=1 Tax=Kuraishia capsulata CBS 1993 TaxID=1382522 RepID=W6MVF4_9ASCO|nr:uncharacterized protein KUCA_T00005921001 [Kuraishia capsulata CBS 1993]CDK29927.1 unnamed protein product [Kuraishia capsulata CBS 1993]
MSSHSLKFAILVHEYSSNEPVHKPKLTFLSSDGHQSVVFSNDFPQNIILFPSFCHHWNPFHFISSLQRLSAADAIPLVSSRFLYRLYLYHFKYFMILFHPISSYIILYHPISQCTPKPGPIC